MRLTLQKYHALGNDYLVFDPSKNPEAAPFTPFQIKHICHRNFGAGSDGILYGPEKGKLALKIFNPDGSEAEKSGNGIRIFSQYLLDAGYVKKETPFILHTLGGNVEVSFQDDGLIRVNMGKATFISNEIPVSGPKREVIDEAFEVAGHQLKITCVSVGNPHCVVPLNDISRHLAEEIGPQIENNPLFPNRINMQLLKVMDRKNIRIEIWERGAGYTLASGSSSCAAASAAYKLGLIDPEVTVHMPGGKLSIEIKADGSLLMTGPVSPVGTIILDPSFFDSIPPGL